MGKYIKKNHPPRSCKVCGKEFKPFRLDNIYCSDNCRWNSQSKRPDRIAKRKITHKAWKVKNPDIVRNLHYKRTYGITLLQYNEILEKQNNCCAVCKKHESEFKKRLAVDHDHKTLEIFGLLCTHCNHRVIGRTRNPEIFLEASKYLEKGIGLYVPKPSKKPKKRKKRKARDRK